MKKLKTIVIIICIAFSFISCRKLKGYYQIIVKNESSFYLNQIEIKCGAEPIFFEVDSNSISNEQTLNIGGREIVAPIRLSINLYQYLNDSITKDYNKGVTIDREKLIRNQINVVVVKIDSTKLPEVKFDFNLNN